MEPDGKRLPAGQNHSRTVRGASRANTRRGGSRRRRPMSHLSGTGPQREPGGALSTKAGRTARNARRHLPRPLAGHNRRPARRAQNRRRLCATGPDLSKRTAGVHAERFQAGTARHPTATAQCSAPGQRAPDLSRQRMETHLQRTPGETSGAGRLRKPRLRDLHFRVHRPTQGRADSSSRRGQLPPLDAARARPEQR